ncbi:MAG TPA: methyl-accepting chemotaxis protein [Actinophytocola sp.]|uniref:methyl-accepting chemotaxis protein n=1 Tax=Actinophytocola sp. TaxID=1872138 RepID=UPI002DBE98DC|nr:methyl-accepting chemotaxis protein [Actinophytocola sp.]HEU5472653.1 methyl-accepting chemotaxis protein [Actinophytocola sp.]
MNFLDRLVPQVRLSDAAFAARHRVLRVILWLHIPLTVGVAVYAGNAGFGGGAGHAGHSGPPAGHVLMVWLFIGGALLCAVLSGMGSRRTRAILVSSGLLLAASALVHGGGGMTDLHFHYFVVLALISLYQDWVAFALAIAMVAVHHLVLGIVVPDMVFSSPEARANPFGYALLHAVFVLGMCAAQVAYWRYSVTSQREADTAREQAQAQSRAALEQAAAEATEREEAAATEAAAQLAQREELSGQLEDVLNTVAGTGVRLAGDAGEAMETFQAALEQAKEVVGSATLETATAMQDATHAGEVMATLRAGVNEIVAISTMIKSVAHQTNLLALNATIEAARAGAAGRGFGVVAEEVKELAAQTGRATDRIEATIAQVTAGTEAIASAMATVSTRLDTVAGMQRDVTRVIAEQTGIAATTRTSVVDAAGQVSAAVHGFQAQR